MANFPSKWPIYDLNGQFSIKMAVFYKKTYGFEILLFGIDIFLDFFNRVNFSLNGLGCCCFCVCNLLKFIFSFIQKWNMLVEILFKSSQSIESFFDFSLSTTNFIFATLPSVDQIRNIDREFFATRIVITFLLETTFSTTIFLMWALVGFKLFSGKFSKIFKNWISDFRPMQEFLKIFSLKFLSLKIWNSDFWKF